jgi:hypothetical protein
MVALHDPPAAISPTLVIADLDDTHLQGGSVAIAASVSLLLGVQARADVHARDALSHLAASADLQS